MINVTKPVGSLQENSADGTDLKHVYAAYESIINANLI